MTPYFLNVFSLMSPTWIAEDVIIYLLAAAFIFYLVRQYPSRAPYLLLEFAAFVFLYGAVYENLAVTVMHYYSYGPSLIMIGNVPLSVPVFEALVFLAGLLLCERLRLPMWTWPIIIGFFAILQDLSLDPISVSQRAPVGSSFSARWQWLIVKPGDASMFNEPIFNWTGWMLMTAFAVVFVLLGRWWFKKSNNNPVVGVVYPILAMLASLSLLMTPVSMFLIWLGPIFSQGSIGEWITFSTYLIAPFILLIVLFVTGKIGRLSFRDAWPLAAIFVVFHLSDVVFTLVGGYTNVLWIVVTATVAHTLILLAVLLRARSVTPSPGQARVPEPVEKAPVAF